MPKTNNLYPRFWHSIKAQIWQSLVPILFWILVGFVVDKDLHTVFSLTYPLQFVYLLLMDLVVYSGFTFCKNDKARESEDYMLSLTVIVFLINIVIWSVIWVLFRRYCMLMHFEDIKYVEWGYIQIFGIFSAGFSGTFRLYYLFNKEDKEANKCMFLGVCLPFVVSFLFCFTKRYIIVLSVNIIVSSLSVLYYSIKVFHRFKFKFDIMCLRYGIPDIVDNIGMLIFFAFGIEAIGGDSFTLMVAYNLDTMLSDWLWDMKILAIEPVIRSEICSEDFDYGVCIKQYRVTYLLLGSLYLIIILVAPFLFDVDRKLFYLVSGITLIYMFFYSFYKVEESLLLINNKEVQYAILNGVEYIFRIIVAVLNFVWLFIGAGLIMNIMSKIYTVIAWRKNKGDILNGYGIREG